MNFIKRPIKNTFNGRIECILPDKEVIENILIEEAKKKNGYKNVLIVDKQTGENEKCFLEIIYIDNKNSFKEFSKRGDKEYSHIQNIFTKLVNLKDDEAVGETHILIHHAFVICTKTRLPSIWREKKLIEVPQNPHSFIVIKTEFWDKNLKEVLIEKSINEKSVDDLQNALFKNWEKQKKYMSQLATGLEFLHKQMIMHRNINTENIFLDESKGILKIGEFRNAQMWHEKAYGINHPDGPKRYKSYQMRSRINYSINSDVYSLGIIFFEILSPKIFHTDDDYNFLLGLVDACIDKEKSNKMFHGFEDRLEMRQLIRSMLDVQGRITSENVHKSLQDYKNDGNNITIFYGIDEEMTAKIN